MINILSVDFDWIMEPSIGLYNSMIHGSNSEMDWETIKTFAPGVTFEADYNKYWMLTLYLGNIVHTDHHAIIDAMKDWGINQKHYCLYNIDHHHDCGYGNMDVENYVEELAAQPLNCGNWVIKALDQFPNLKRYTWIDNKNSDAGLRDDIISKFKELVIVSDINVLNFINIDYDTFASNNLRH